MPAKCICFWSSLLLILLLTLDITMSIFCHCDGWSKRLWIAGNSLPAQDSKADVQDCWKGHNLELSTWILKSKSSGLEFVWFFLNCSFKFLLTPMSWNIERLCWWLMPSAADQEHPDQNGHFGTSPTGFMHWEAVPTLKFRGILKPTSFL